MWLDIFDAFVCHLWIYIYKSSICKQSGISGGQVDRNFHLNSFMYIFCANICMYVLCRYMYNVYMASVRDRHTHIRNIFELRICTRLKFFGERAGNKLECGAYINWMSQWIKIFYNINYIQRGYISFVST